MVCESTARFPVGSRRTVADRFYLTEDTFDSMRGPCRVPDSRLAATKSGSVFILSRPFY